MYDVIVIGGGPGGYVCAIKCAHLGMKVAIIEKRTFTNKCILGGTCLNVGCIPSKNLLDGTYKYETAKEMGFDCNFNDFFKKMMEKKNDVINKLGSGIDSLMKKNKIDIISGIGIIESRDKVRVNDEVLECNRIVIATGSVPSSVPDIDFNGNDIVSSDEALSFSEVPKKFAIVGAGVIGLEIGSMWNRLGSDVTVIEYCDSILSTMDKDVSKEMLKLLKKQGMKFELGCKVVNASDGVIKFHNIKSDIDSSLEYDKVLISTGRKPCTDGLGIDSLGDKIVNEKGQVIINDNFETKIPGIYAIGDVVHGPMLAHKAEEEGVYVAEMFAGQKPHIDYNLIPSVVYTHPEIASVGKTEQELKDSGVEYQVGKFSMGANSRSIAVGETDGFVKVITGKCDTKILGVHIIGSAAGAMIPEAVVAMEYKASAEDLARICHPHPDFGEAIKEAAMAAYDKSIHS